MQNTKNQARGSGIHARHNPTNDKTVSDDLQNVSGNIAAPPRYRLTKLGEQMARLPIDPKIARILLAAKKHDCMAEILVIASALSIQDPRERPLEVAEHLVSPLPICSQPSVCGAAEKTGSTAESSCFATGLNSAYESCTGNAVQAA